MRARLKSLRSDEIHDLAHFVPAHPDEFAVPLVLEVGPLGLKGRERFDLLVTTPQWLRTRHGARGAVPGRGKLLVFEWDFERIKGWLTRQIEGCTGKSWPEVVRKVERIADWEGSEENVVELK
jgi:hypothetical protein